MKRIISLVLILLLLAACDSKPNGNMLSDKSVAIEKEYHTHQLGPENGCEQVEFSSIPADSLDLFIDLDTVFENYTSESLLIHIPDSISIVNGDNNMKILLQSGNYSAINSIEKSKVYKDGENCLYNYIVLNLKMNSSQPTVYPTEYEMSVPITASEWSTTDLVLLQIDGENKKLASNKTGGEPREKPPIHN